MAQALWLYLRKRGREPGPLFLSVRGGRLSPSGVSQVLSNASERAGCKVRSHQLRHTWTDAMLAAGLSEHDVATLAGWTSTAQLARYGRARATDRAVAAGRQVSAIKLLRKA